MESLYITTGIALLISLLFDKEKTKNAVKAAITQFIRLLPAIFSMLIFVSITLFYVPDTIIIKYLSIENIYSASIIASTFGSIAIMPGFIAFPLCGILSTKGIPYMVLSAFTSTLMMVGIITYPVERAYFSTRTTILRNLIGFIMAIIVALVTGLLYREIF